jgi:LemA protein
LEFIFDAPSSVQSLVMTTTGIVLIAIAAVVILLVLALATIYNRLVTLRQRFLNAFAQIDVQLKRRHDLIPNLVETVKGYMAHERQTLEAVIAARGQAVRATGAAAANPRDAAAVQQAAVAENALVAALGRLLVIGENYPQLRADQNVSSLMEELSSTENRVAFARQAYNDAVMHYNTARLRFPTTLVAPVFGFHDAALFQIDDAAQRQPVHVNLGA